MARTLMLATVLLLICVPHSLYPYEYGGSFDGVATVIVSSQECGGDVGPEEFLQWNAHKTVSMHMNGDTVEYGEVYIHRNPNSESPIREVCALYLRTDTYDVWLYKYSYVKENTRFIFKCRKKVGTVADEQTPLL